MVCSLAFRSYGGGVQDDCKGENLQPPDGTCTASCVFGYTTAAGKPTTNEYTCESSGRWSASGDFACLGVSCDSPPVENAEICVGIYAPDGNLTGVAPCTVGSQHGNVTCRPGFE